MTNQNRHWVAAWGNATSIHDQTESMYAKDLTLRYPCRMVFDAEKIRVRFSNICGKETVKFSASVALCRNGKEIDPNTIKLLLMNGSEEIVIPAGQEIVTDEMDYDIKADTFLSVSIYVKDYTDMNSAVLITGPLSKGYYAYGKFDQAETLPLELSRKTNWYYFLNTIEVYSDVNNKALICYGDSITAQDWPDYLALYAWEQGIRNVSVIRKAISGTRILRQYDNITYAAYGLKGSVRFPVEMNVAGAYAVLIQHGINDIIHPVGVEVNPFRPMSDLPTAEEMAEGIEKIYIEYARKLGLDVYLGTLLPIKGWRTYEPFREDLKNEFNEWLRTTDLSDGCVDFDLATRDPEDPASFRKDLDSGDHLHPSAAGYQMMAKEALKILKQ